VDVSVLAGPSFATARAHRGAAYGDLNNDGRIDVVVTNQNSRPEIFLNRSPGSNHWLLVKLVGNRSNRDGLGARLKATIAGGAPLYNHATTSTGLSASSDPRVHFGLGAATRLEKLEIWWPSGIYQILSDVKADRILKVQEAAQ
jgi:hypothetical protein